MGCTQSSRSPDDTAGANLRAMERNERRGKDRMGHDIGMRAVTPGSPEDIILSRETRTTRTTGFLSAAGMGGGF
jgi:hypothetical protein